MLGEAEKGIKLYSVDGLVYHQRIRFDLYAPLWKWMLDVTMCVCTSRGYTKPKSIRLFEAIMD